MLAFWNETFECFKTIQAKLHKRIKFLRVPVPIFTNLMMRLWKHGIKFDYFETKITRRLPDAEYRKMNSRQIFQRRQINDGQAADADLSPRDKFRVYTFIPINHWRSIHELTKRVTMYTIIADKFSILIDLELLNETRNVSSNITQGILTPPS